MSSNTTQKKRKASLSASVLNEIERERARVESMNFAEARDALQEHLLFPLDSSNVADEEKKEFQFATVYALFQEFPKLAKEKFAVQVDNNGEAGQASGVDNASVDGAEDEDEEQDDADAEEEQMGNDDEEENDEQSGGTNEETINQHRPLFSLRIMGNGDEEEESGEEEEIDEQGGGTNEETINVLIEPVFALICNLGFDPQQHLELLKMVHELNSNALQSKPAVIWNACQDRAPEAVILFLIEKFPEAAGHFKGHKSALHLVLEWETPSIDIVEALVKASPRLLGRPPFSNGKSPLGIALDMCMDSSMLKLLLPNDPSITSCHLTSAIYGAGDIGPEVAATLASSFSPNITDLTVTSTDFTPEGFKAFLVGLALSSTLSNVTHSECNRPSDDTHLSAMCEGISYFLEYSTSVASFTLELKVMDFDAMFSGRERDDGFGDEATDKLMNAVAMGFLKHHGSNLVELRLAHSSVGSGLDVVLSKYTKLKSLKLFECSFRAQHVPAIARGIRQNPSLSLIKMQRCDLGDSGLALVDAIGGSTAIKVFELLHAKRSAECTRLPRLRNLDEIKLSLLDTDYISGTLSIPDLTSHIIDLLRDCPNLVSLEIQYRGVKMDMLLQVLETNKFLKLLIIQSCEGDAKDTAKRFTNLLRDHNRVLERVVLYPSSGHTYKHIRHDELEFFCDLNACGREQVQESPDMAKREFVALLAGANDTCEDFEYIHHWTTGHPERFIHTSSGKGGTLEQVLSVQYSLLREKPHMWSQM